MKRSFTAIVIAGLLAGPAFAADLPARMPVKAASLPPSMAYNWAGYYVGIHAGYSWGELTSANDITIDHEPAGGLYGGQIGYNWQVNNWVFGFETDISGTNIRGDDATTFGPFNINVSSKLNYMGTVRARAGIAFDRVLAYVTGGFAYGNIDGHVNVVGVVSGSDSVNLKGWTYGGGIDYALTPSLTARVEYLYVDFNKATTTINLGFPFSDQFDKNINIVRGGLNYKLGTGGFLFGL
jgi:outer membrane immunogenic protein